MCLCGPVVVYEEGRVGDVGEVREGEGEKGAELGLPENPTRNSAVTLWLWGMGWASPMPKIAH